MNFAKFRELWFELKRRELGIGIRLRFSSPDASRDVCKKCGAMRKEHPRICCQRMQED